MNWPYSGAMVPMEFHRCDVRVVAIMMEINRVLYMDEWSGEKLAGIDGLAASFKECVGNFICTI